MGTPAGTDDYTYTAHPRAAAPARSDIEVIFDEHGPPLGGMAPPQRSGAEAALGIDPGDQPDPGEFNIRTVVKILDVVAIVMFFYWLVVVMGTIDRMNRIDPDSGIWDFLAVPLDFAPALLVSVVALSAAAVIRVLTRRPGTSLPGPPP